MKSKSKSYKLIDKKADSVDNAKIEIVETLEKTKVTTIKELKDKIKFLSDKKEKAILDIDAEIQKYESLLIEFEEVTKDVELLT